MTDVVLLQIISYIFWFGLALLLVIVFNREIKALVGSLTSVNVAGAHFELRDNKTTIESYAMLSEIFVELLSSIDAAEQLYPMISDRNARRLAKFTLQYAEEVPKNEQDAELLKGVGHILGRRGLYNEAIQIYDALLKKDPDDFNVLNLKGVVLLNTGMPKEIERAKKIYDQLVSTHPREGMVWFNRSLAKSLLGQFDESLSDIERVIELDYWKIDPELLSDPLLSPLQNARSREFDELGVKIRNLVETAH